MTLRDYLYHEEDGSGLSQRVEFSDLREVRLPFGDDRRIKGARTDAARDREVRERFAHA